MIARLRCVSVALAALLTTASACLAAEPGYESGKGGVGGGIGYSKFLADADYSSDSRGRPSFAGAFRYVMTPHWRWQVSPGMTWSAYGVGSTAPFPDPQFPGDTSLAGVPVKDHYLTLVLPVNAQLQFTQRHGWWVYHLGAGPGVYRVWVENNRKILEDPVSHNRHRGLYFGFTGELGAERFLRGLTTTSIEGVLGTHLVFAERDDQFPSGFNSNVAPLDVRIGVNYYFDMVRAKKTEEPGGLPKP
ncbi:MAG TPA: hypothetical protein VI792_03800 [Candidatus Eisenbacteria bacterium]